MKLDYFELDKKKAVNIYLTKDENCQDLIDELKKTHRVFIFHDGSQPLDCFLNALTNY